MKGVVFNNLQEMVEQQAGFEVWDELIESCDLASGGVYTSSRIYDDEEILALVGGLSERLDTPIPDLLRAFGKFLFRGLHGSIKDMVELPNTLFDYLAGVHSVIHVEVKKLDAQAEVPELSVIERNEKQISLAYRSPKQLCHLAIGLIEGTAELFGETVNITMPKCTHEGAEFCELVISY